MPEPGLPAGGAAAQGAADYSAADLRRALQAAGLVAGDIVYCHSNLGFFGRAEGAPSRDALCRLFFDVLMDTLGPQGTLVVPTYTYSFSNGRAFDPVTSASAMGLFAEWVRQHPDARRSADPFYSVAAIGPAAAALCDDLPPNSFSADSTFGRFLEADGRVLCLNHPGCTFLHHAERVLGVPYRFDKRFHGLRLEQGQATPLAWDIWVRYLSDDLLEHDPGPFVSLAKARGAARWAGLGRGEVLGLRARDIVSLLRETLPQQPWLLTQAHRAGRTPVVDTQARGRLSLQVAAEPVAQHG